MGSRNQGESWGSGQNVDWKAIPGLLCARPMRYLLPFCYALTTSIAAESPRKAIPDEFESIPSARFAFTNRVGERIEANLDNWLLRAPQANPGMLEMFRVRDRRPKPELVPWAGEFVGKYLVSAVEAIRLT